MPELPEIEMIRRVIEPQIKGLAIKNAIMNRSEVVEHPTTDEFCEKIIGQTFDRIERRGKFLKFVLQSGDNLILHLRMTGCLLLTPCDYEQEKHTHVVFALENGNELRFSDTRRFGRFWLIENGETDTYSGIDKLGVEPLSVELTAEYLRTNLGKRKKAIKECLLDQTVIAGIGNIYSDEILFASGIDPAAPANALRQKDWETLAEIIPERLSYFIEKNKLSPDEYLESKGKDYRNTPFLQVYGRGGKPCPKCGKTLCRTVICGRGSVYCPKCQKKIIIETA